jgi:tight adherence protein B
MVVIVALLILAAVESGRRGLGRVRAGRAIAQAGTAAISSAEPATSARFPRRVALPTFGEPAARNRFGLLGAGIGLLGAAAGLQLVGLLGIAAGVAVGATLPHLLRARQIRKREVELERQLADVAESTAMAVRSGYSIAQALAFAAEEATAPMSGILLRFIQEKDLGTPFEDALRQFADDLGTSDARLFALIVSIHARSGGNLAVALDEVAGTIRHRIAVRRELRALSAQGRISGSILGALPIAFFLVLAATSHSELAPVYRSPVGIAMITSGLLMEGLAFVWIRRLLRVEA